MIKKRLKFASNFGSKHSQRQPETIVRLIQLCTKNPMGYIWMSERRSDGERNTINQELSSVLPSFGGPNGDSVDRLPSSSISSIRHTAMISQKREQI